MLDVDGEKSSKMVATQKPSYISHLSATHTGVIEFNGMTHMLDISLIGIYLNQYRILSIAVNPL